MGNRNDSGWDVLDRIDNGSTKYLGNETWRVRHSSYPAERVDEYSIQLADDYVQVVGLTDDGRAVLIIEDHVANGLTLQAVAGGIKEHQTPNQAALAEFEEESGRKASELIRLGDHVTQTDRIVSRTKGNNGAKRCYMYLALGLAPSEQKLETTEKIRPVLVPWGLAMEAATNEAVLSWFQLSLRLEDTGSRLIMLLADKKLKSLGRKRYQEFLRTN